MCSDEVWSEANLRVQDWPKCSTEFVLDGCRGDDSCEKSRRFFSIDHEAMCRVVCNQTGEGSVGKGIRVLIEPLSILVGDSHSPLHLPQTNRINLSV